MRRLKSFAITAAILAIPLTSYGWTRTYGSDDDDIGYCIQLTIDTGYIICGDWNDSHACLIKTDEWGEETWMQIYGNDTIFSAGHYVCPTLDTGYIITGGISIPGGVTFTDLWLLKTNSEGDTLWTHTYSGDNTDYGNCIDQTSDSGYIVIGTTHSFPWEGPAHIWLLCTDKTGDTLWAKNYRDEAEGNCVQTTDDGGFIIACRIGIMKLDSDGRRHWSYNYGEGPFSTISSRYVQQTEDGGYIVTGNKNNKAFLLKANKEGDSLWMKTFGESNAHNLAHCVQQTKDGGYIICGTHLYSSYNYVLLLKTDSLGNALWTHKYGGDDDCGYSVRQTPDGGYIVVGETRSLSSRGGLDILLLKTNEYGDTLWYEVSPVIVEKPQEGDTIAYMIPAAWFKNTGTYPAEDFYCHCEISSNQFHTPDYHVKYWISYSIEPGDSFLVKFSPWACDDSATYTARFYTTKESEPIWQTREKTVTFYGEPFSGAVEDQPINQPPYWEIVTSCGHEIVLSYSNFPDGLQGRIFDASGREVEELKSVDASGTITWGDTAPTGVYFIRISSGARSAMRKVILLR